MESTIPGEDLPECFSKYYEIEKVIQFPNEDSFIKNWVVLARKTDLQLPFHQCVGNNYQEDEFSKQENEYKIILKVFQNSQDSQFSFFHEVEALSDAKLNGINYVPNIYATGMIISKHEYLIIEMEYVPGEPFLPQNKQQVIKYFSMILDCLEKMNNLNWNHCDIKPEHIYLRKPSDRICILDWGSALNFVCDDPEEIVYCIGTKPFLAPERIQTDINSKNGDVFSLGMLLYRWISGNEPNYDHDPNDKFCIKYFNWIQRFYQNILSNNYLPDETILKKDNDQEFIEKIFEILRATCNMISQKRISIQEFVILFQNL